jgi:hypothetical protein
MSEPYFKKRIFVRFIFTFAFLFFVGIVIVYAAQWNEPSAQPPGNNVESPINISGTAQTKLGGFGIDTTAIGLDEPFSVRKNNYYFFVGVNRGGGNYVDIGAYHSTLGWRNLVLNRDGGNVGIGTTDPAGYKLRVTGTVRGTAFYDEDNTSYYLDPSNSGTALKVLGSINLGSYYTNGNVGGIYFDSWPRSYITTSDDTWVNDLLLASDWNISLRATNNINFYPGGTSLNARLSGYMADTGAFVWYGSLSAANISMYESGSGCGAPNRFINFNKGGSAIYDNCDMVFQTDDNWYWYSTWHRHNEMKLNYANGDLSIRGSYYCNQSIDVAEMIYSNQKTGLEAGDVVVVDPDNDETVITSSKPYDSTVAGIISTEPGLVLGSGFEGDTAKGNVELSLVGRVPCKVTTENGPVKRGDLLVTSSKPGYAMKGDPEKIKEMPGVVLGKALEELKEGEGKILVLISLR